MARKSFFSFHYKGDNWRASIVRNSWVTQERKAAGFFDSAEWEKVKKRKDSDIEDWIDGQLFGTSVTVVLIGENTAGRKWINYEIRSSFSKGNGLLGIYVHNLKDKEQRTSKKGRNPFNELFIIDKGKKIYYSEIFETYDWVNDDGYTNMGYWIEKAAKNAGK